MSVQLGISFFTIRYPRVLRMAPLTHAFEGFTVAAPEVYPGMAACPMSLFLLFRALYLWILLDRLKPW